MSDILIGIDAKFGTKKVRAYDIIEPESYHPFTGEVIPPKMRMNLQLAMYLLGTYRKYEFEGRFTRAKGIIVQPFLNHVSEYECSIDELLELGEWIKARAEATRKNPEFKPSDENCFFCKARFDCHARNYKMLATAVDGFEDEGVPDARTAKPKPVTMPKLGEAWALIPMLRRWCDETEKRVLDELHAGNRVLGPDGKPLKLVEGQKGDRCWDNPQEVEQMMLKMRLKEDAIYKPRQLITPAAAEKLAPKEKRRRGVEPAPSVIGPTQWTRLKERIVQPSGKAVVAMSNDPRPELKNLAADMPEVPDDDNYDPFATL